MVRTSVLRPVLVLGLFSGFSGCAVTDSPSETADTAVADSPHNAESSEALQAPPAPHGCIQITRPRIEYWSEFPPEPGNPAPLDPYKTCVTQPDCSSICEGEDVTPSVYSWHLTIRCTSCT